MLIRILLPTYFVRNYKTYIEFFPWSFLQNYHLYYLMLYNYRYILFTSLLGGIILTSILPHSRFIKLLVTRHLFKSSPGEKEMHMFYIASFITFLRILVVTMEFYFVLIFY